MMQPTTRNQDGLAKEQAIDEINALHAYAQRSAAMGNVHVLNPTNYCFGPWEIVAQRTEASVQTEDHLAERPRQLVTSQAAGYGHRRG